MASRRAITLDERLRDIAARGELTYLSLIPVAGKGTDGVVWSASYSPASAWGHGMARHADPVEALMLAIDEKLPPERRRKTPMASEEVPAGDTTAVVGVPDEEPETDQYGL
jgi:hypothetical protein